MPVKVEQVANVMGLAPDVLETRALKPYLEHQLAEAEAEISQLTGKYGVASPQALKAAIDAGHFPEHPTWEDVISWSNLIAFTERAHQALRLLRGEHPGVTDEALQRMEHLRGELSRRGSFGRRFRRPDRGSQARTDVMDFTHSHLQGQPLVVGIPGPRGLRAT